jgi:hypothetical protein
MPSFVKICHVQTRKKPRPKHFIGAASSNKVKASINNMLLSLEIYLCDFKLLLSDFAECKGVLIALLLTTFLKQFKPVKDKSTLYNPKQLHNIPVDKKCKKIISPFVNQYRQKNYVPVCKPVKTKKLSFCCQLVQSTKIKNMENGKF